MVKNGTTVLEDRSYVDGIEYNGNTFDFAQTSEGRVMAIVSPSTYHKYEYFLKDHLGNVRATFSDLTGGHNISPDDILQTNDYFPFGRTFNGFTATGSKDQQYKYNGKEFEDDEGEYDYGARFYDPYIARWNVIDPMAENSKYLSSYGYVENNPVRFTDPNGMEVSKDDFGNMTYTGQDAVNFGKSLQEQLNNVVQSAVVNALSVAGINSTGGNISSGPPKDGDVNRKGLIYSADYKQWLPRFAYFDLQKAKRAQKQAETNFKNSDNGMYQGIALVYGLGKAAVIGTLTAEIGGYFFRLAGLTLFGEGAGVVYENFNKIFPQMAVRGWTVEAVEEVIVNPSAVGATVNRATGNAATAFFDKAGSYIVKDNITNDIIQISNRNDAHWVVDPAIKIVKSM